QIMILRCTRVIATAASDVGIDIGSANTVVASAHSGVLFDEPTCVAVNITDRAPVVFGHEAAAATASDRVRERLEVVRPINRARVADVEAFASFLKHIVNTVDAK